jgi:hypothetical protein
MRGSGFAFTLRLANAESADVPSAYRGKHASLDLGGTLFALSRSVRTGRPRSQVMLL